MYIPRRPKEVEKSNPIQKVNGTEKNDTIQEKHDELKKSRRYEMTLTHNMPIFNVFRPQARDPTEFNRLGNEDHREALTL